jgi:uncharacterized protein YdeI (YjbR/CyaY-like superfamily)
VARDPRIDAYIEGARPFAQPLLRHLRARVHALLPEVEEALKWSMPAYLVGGRILLITAAFKEHVALNFWRGQELRGAAADADAMGQFGRLRSLGDLPAPAELDRLILEAAELARSAPPARRPKHQPKPAAEIPADFAEALEKAPQARQHLDSFPPSARRDYVDWIAEAKRPETRAKRIATALEWLSEGKRRNWKYERC